jgi:hypothetical protein
LTTATRYYTISIILGTVALSYGSVPMYKMVSPTAVKFLGTRVLKGKMMADDKIGTDMPANRMGRSTD